MVRQAGRQVVRLQFEFWLFYIWPPVSILLYLMMYYMLCGLALFRKGDYCHVKCPRMIYKGGILGNVQIFWCDPCLNGTNVLFDNGNDLPLHTLHLEFSNEKQKITK